MGKTYKSGVLITGDSSGAVKSIKLTQDQLGKLNSKTKESESSVKKYADVASKSYSIVGTAAKAGLAAVGAALGGIAALTKNGLASVDALAKTADSLGITTQQLATFQHAADLTGTSASKLVVGFRVMQKNLTEAASGMGIAKDALAGLGLSAEELVKMAPEKAFGKIGDAINRVENPTQRTALAMKIMGRSGTDLIKTMQLGSAGMEDIARKTQIAGTAIDRVSAQQVENANDAFAGLTLATKGFGEQMAIKVAPALEEVSKAIFGVIEEAGGMEEVTNNVFEFMLKGAGYVGDSIRGLQSIWALVANTMQEFFANAADAVGGFVSMVVEGLNKLPGVNIEFEGSGFDLFAKSMRSAAEQSRARIDEMMEKPLPSETFRQYYEEAAARSRASAQAQVDAAGTIQGAAVDTDQILSGLNKKQQNESAALAKKLDEERRKLEEKIEAQRWAVYATQLSEREQARLNAQLALGTEATQEQRIEVDRLATALFDHEDSVRRSEQAIKDKTEADKKHAEELEKQREEAIKPWADAMTGAVERIDEAFAEAWKGSLDSFSDFADAMKESFKTLLAEMAHLAITRPIVMSIAGSLGLGGASGAMAGTPGGIASGGIGGIGSLISGAKSIWTGGTNFFSTLSAGGSFTDAMGAAFGGGGGSFGSMLNGMGGSLYGGLADLGGSMGINSLRDAAFNQQLSYMDGGLGANLANAGLNIGAGMAGSWAGGKVGAALFGERKTTGIGSTLGGVIGSAWGPPGAGIGSFLGSIAESAVGKIFGLGDQARWGKLGVTTGDGVPTDGSAIETITGASGLKLSAVAKRTDSDAAKQLLQGFAAIDTALTEAARAAGVTVDFAGKVLGNTSLDVEGNGPKNSFGVGARLDKFSADAIAGSADDFAKAWVAEISDQLPKRVRNALKGADTADQFVGIFTNVSQIDKLLGIKALQQVRDNAEAASRSIFSAYEETNKGLLDLTANYDGSLDGMTQLTAALGMQKELALGLAQAYYDVSKAIKATFDQSINAIEESALSDEELYAKRRREIGKLTGDLANTIDPQEIANLTQQINSLASAAWSQIDESQRAGMKQEFLDFLEGARDLAQAQVEAGRDALKAAEAGTAEAIDAALMNGAAKAQQEAAANLNAAASKLADAAGFLANFHNGMFNFQYQVNHP